MASRHRRRTRRAKKIATMGAATATVTAMTMGVAPPDQANAAGTFDAILGGLADSLLGSVPAALQATPGSPGLPPMELAPGAPDPASIPDLTFGLGTREYDAFQTVGAALETFILDNVNLSGLLQALGYDPEELVNDALGTALTQLLAGIPVDLSGIPVVGAILAAAGLDNVLALTNLIGLDLSNPLNLAGTAAPGLNIITTGAPFSLLKFVGVDLGWMPEFLDSVADEINGTPYLDLAAVSLLTKLRNLIPANSLANIAFRDTLAATIATIEATAPGGDIDLVNLRIPVVAGFGVGAFAAGMAYPQVVAQLPYQPGGALYDGESAPLAGSFTVLPMILLRNPGRANGGLFARFYPLAALAGINTVTPDTAVSSSYDPQSTPLLQIAGLTVGGANLIPIKIDATVEYDPLSDVPSWFNPLSLLNAGAAGLFPTYILRGLELNDALGALGGQAGEQLTEALGNVALGDPLALNLYLTLPADSLPLLEPVRLPIDVINLVTGVNLNNPLATALEPALRILVNLGFTDVDQQNGYERTLDQADVITPFGTMLADIDWGRVPEDVFEALVAGIEQAVADGIVSSTPVDNPLRTLVNVIESLLGEDPGASALNGLTDAPNSLLSDGAASMATESGGFRTQPAVPPAVVASEPPASQEDLERPGAPADALTDVTDDGIDSVKQTARQARNQLDETVGVATERTERAVKRARTQASETVKNAGKALNEIAKNGRNEIKKAVDGVDKQVKKTVKKAESSSERDSVPSAT